MYPFLIFAVQHLPDYKTKPSLGLPVPTAGQPQGSEPRAAASAAWAVHVTKGLSVKMGIVVLESIHHPMITGTALKGDLSGQSRRTYRNSRESLAKILLPTEVTTFRDTGPVNVREGSLQRA